MSSYDDFLIHAVSLMYSLKLEMANSFLLLGNLKEFSCGWWKLGRNVFEISGTKICICHCSMTYDL